jgi:hypothetical protein
MGERGPRISDGMCDWTLTYADVSAPGDLPLREGKREQVSYKRNLLQSPEGGYRTFTSSISRLNEARNQRHTK